MGSPSFSVSFTRSLRLLLLFSLKRVDFSCVAPFSGRPLSAEIYFLNSCTFVSVFSKSTLLPCTFVHQSWNTLNTLKHKKGNLPIFNTSWVGLFYSSHFPECLKWPVLREDTEYVTWGCVSSLCLTAAEADMHMFASVFGMVRSKAKNFFKSFNASRPTQGHPNYLRGKRLAAITPELCFRHGSWYYFLEQWEPI